MTMQEIAQALLAGLENMSWTEALAVAFAIVSVLCARANSVWVYPSGIAGILLSIWIFIGSAYRLYPDAALNAYYLVMSVYGWYVWTRRPPGGESAQTPVSWCSRREWGFAILLFVLLWAGLYGWLSAYRINNVPFLDSFCSSLACAGMWLLARRKIENWLFLLAADAAAVPLYFYKHLLLFCGLNLFYVVIAWLGFLAWKKTHAREKARGPLAH